MYCLTVFSVYTGAMARESKPSKMPKVVPVKMPEALHERLKEIAEKVGEAESTIIRIVLRAGLTQIEKDNYTLFRFNDTDAPPIRLVAEKPAKCEASSKKHQPGPVERAAEKLLKRSQGAAPQETSPARGLAPQQKK